MSEPRTSGTIPPGPELVELLAELEAVRRDSHDLLDGLSEVQLNWRPDRGRWSIAQNLTHLTVLGRLYLPQVDSAIRQAREHGWRRPGPYRYGPFGNWLVRFMEPPVVRRIRAPRMFKPQPVQPLADVESAFLELQGELEARVRQAAGLDLRRAKVATVITSLVRISLGQAFQALLAHERRHLWQARQVRGGAGFPVT